MSLQLCAQKFKFGTHKLQHSLISLMMSVHFWSRQKQNCHTSLRQQSRIQQSFLKTLSPPDELECGDFAQDKIAW